MTFAHFSVSSAMRFPYSAGERASTVPPRSAKRAFILGAPAAVAGHGYRKSRQWFGSCPDQTTRGVLRAASVPILLAAPARFSTTNWWPRRSESHRAITRAQRNSTHPRPVRIRKLIGRYGALLPLFRL